MPEISASKYLVTAGWDDVPHLDEKTKAELLEATPPHLRKARSQGIPSLGAGAIYPVDPDEIKIRPFPIPDYWPRAFALDVGWKRTAAMWGARDPTDGVTYLYAEHYMGQAVPAIHAEAIKARGPWIKGAIDPAARKRREEDGRRLMAQYQSLGLSLVPAKNAVEAGLYQVWQLLATGRLKVFSNLLNYFEEYNEYRRDEDGKVVKDFDHLMDAKRYLIMTWDAIASVKPVEHTSVPSIFASDTKAGY